uniref:Uncharacterized protein n=1 Tax=Lepeophtheirus salmonis TaxID=72036 RepID=A0A0K2THG0_LEPSM
MIKKRHDVFYIKKNIHGLFNINKVK